MQKRHEQISWSSMTPLGDNQPPKAVTYLDAKTTLRLEVNPGDYLIWVRWKNMFSPKSGIGILDFWELREGDSIAITSRIEDLPPWFDIHPTEVSGSAVYWMMKKLDNGYKPREPLDGPNLWRIRAGDRLVWIKSPDLETSVPRQAVFAFRCDTLVFGDRHLHSEDPAWFLSFGAPLESSPNDELAIEIRAGLEIVRQMGLPREMADIDSNWTLA